LLVLALFSAIPAVLALLAPAGNGFMVGRRTPSVIL